MAHNMPAFPCEAQGDRSVPPEHDYLQTGIHAAKFPGMTLRDWFAGQALMGCMAAEAPDVIYKRDDVACRAFAIADAMLAARTTPIASPGNHASNRGSVEGDHNRREPGV